MPTLYRSLYSYALDPAFGTTQPSFGHLHLKWDATLGSLRVPGKHPPWLSIYLLGTLLQFCVMRHPLLMPASPMDLQLEQVAEIASSYAIVLYVQYSYCAALQRVDVDV